jgi:hypothetical protein
LKVCEGDLITISYFHGLDSTKNDQGIGLVFLPTAMQLIYKYHEEQLRVEKIDRAPRSGLFCTPPGNIFIIAQYTVINSIKIFCDFPHPTPRGAEGETPLLRPRSVFACFLSAHNKKT